MTDRLILSLLCVVLLSSVAEPAKAKTPELVSATFLGTKGDDDFQDVAIAADGTVYVAGNLDRQLIRPPGNVPTKIIGQEVPGTW